MICLECNNEEFVSGERTIVQHYGGYILNVTTSVMVCTKCGYYCIGEGQFKELLTNTKKAYQEVVQ